MFVIPKSSIRHHNKSYEYENNNKSRQKPKIQKGARKCRGQLKHKLFSENLIFDAFKVFSEQRGTINIRILEKKIEM